jgi:hypothetical protein
VANQLHADLERCCIDLDLQSRTSESNSTNHVCRRGKATYPDEIGIEDKDEPPEDATDIYLKPVDAPAEMRPDHAREGSDAPTQVFRSLVRSVMVFPLAPNEGFGVVGKRPPLGITGRKSLPGRALLGVNMVVEVRYRLFPHLDRAPFHLKFRA